MYNDGGEVLRWAAAGAGFSGPDPLDSRPPSRDAPRMRQIPESELRHAISFELKQVPQATLRALASGGSQRTEAIAAITERLMKRMAKWEIMVPEPSGALGSPPNWRGEG